MFVIHTYTQRNEEGRRGVPKNWSSSIVAIIQPMMLSLILDLNSIVDFLLCNVFAVLVKGYTNINGHSFGEVRKLNLELLTPMKIWINNSLIMLIKFIVD